MKAEYLKIGDFSEVFDGPHATPTKTDKGPYYLSISSLENGNLELNKSAHLSSKDFEKWTKRVVPRKGDLLFSYETRLGEAALMPDGIQACLGRRMGILRPDTSKISSEFLLYSYLSPEFQNIIKANTITGATVDRIPLTDMPTFRMRVPELKKQENIVSVLSTLDAKIELNNQINAELEGVAKLLYDYWFVQFDFPITADQAAAMGKPKLEGKPYRASGGKMVYNEKLKREIPEGWADGNILAVSDIGGGATPSKKVPEFWGGEVPFFTPTDAKSEPFCLDTEDHLSNLGLKNNSTRLYPKGTLFITARGSVGKAMIISKEMAMNQSCYALSPHDGVGSAFLYFHTLSLMDYLHAKSSGSVFNSIVTNDINFTPAVVPATQQLVTFDKVTEPMYESILNHQEQNQELTQLRDWLLPMLMNGQVTVGS
ncbi:MAG: restriction endonuclease subunit S [Verrucomicrobia bacterium]|nr:restriction endonuclease subunit S [Verrucomicrobiota bacterium]